jgi:transposase-like protein
VTNSISDVSLLPGEVVLKIAGKTHYLWRAIDQDGIALDVRAGAEL